jgi:hypothetical protein
LHFIIWISGGKASNIKYPSDEPIRLTQRCCSDLGHDGKHIGLAIRKMIEINCLRLDRFSCGRGNEFFGQSFAGRINECNKTLPSFKTMRRRHQLAS